MRKGDKRQQAKPRPGRGPEPARRARAQEKQPGHGHAAQEFGQAQVRGGVGQPLEKEPGQVRGMVRKTRVGGGDPGEKRGPGRRDPGVGADGRAKGAGGGDKGRASCRQGGDRAQQQRKEQVEKDLGTDGPADGKKRRRFGREKPGLDQGEMGQHVAGKAGEKAWFAQEGQSQVRKQQQKVDRVDAGQPGQGEALCGKRRRVRARGVGVEEHEAREHEKARQSRLGQPRRGDGQERMPRQGREPGQGVPGQHGQGRQGAKAPEAGQKRRLAASFFHRQAPTRKRPS